MYSCSSEGVACQQYESSTEHQQNKDLNSPLPMGKDILRYLFPHPGQLLVPWISSPHLFVLLPRTVSP